MALGSWAIRSRRLSPFGPLGKFLRTISDPVLAPVSRLVVRQGGNPQNAEWWLMGIAVIGGILVISAFDFLLSEVGRFRMASGGGVRGIIRLTVDYASQIVTIALVVRVIGSWFGVGRFNRFMRIAYRITDWIVEPLRKIVPPLGMIDITPIVAWLLIRIVTGLVLGVL